MTYLNQHEQGTMAFLHLAMGMAVFSVAVLQLEHISDISLRCFQCPYPLRTIIDSRMPVSSYAALLGAVSEFDSILRI